MSDEIKLRRYFLPNVKGQGWGEFVIGSNGFFAVVSDWDNYAFRWTHTGCDDFRDFLVSLEPDYVASKLGSRDWYDGARTARNIKDYILEARRYSGWSAEKARAEWDLVNRGVEAREDLTHWFEDTRISDPAELISYDFQPMLRSFCKHLLPRFQQVLREEVAKERAACPNP